MVEELDSISHKTKTNKILKFIVRYNILRDGKHVECNIKGWRTALAHARKWQQDLFYNVRRVEILNLWTGEIISLQEAEQRAKKYAQSLKGAVIGTTT